MGFRPDTAPTTKRRPIRLSQLPSSSHGTLPPRTAAEPAQIRRPPLPTAVNRQPWRGLWAPTPSRTIKKGSLKSSTEESTKGDIVAHHPGGESEEPPPPPRLWQMKVAVAAKEPDSHLAKLITASREERAIEAAMSAEIGYRSSMALAHEAWVGGQLRECEEALQVAGEHNPNCDTLHRFKYRVHTRAGKLNEALTDAGNAVRPCASTTKPSAAQLICCALFRSCVLSPSAQVANSPANPRNHHGARTEFSSAPLVRTELESVIERGSTRLRIMFW